MIVFKGESIESEIMTGSYLLKMLWQEFSGSHPICWRPSCPYCRNDHKTNIPIVLDHIKPFTKYPELNYDIQNAQLICNHANLVKGAKEGVEWDYRTQDWVDWLNSWDLESMRSYIKRLENEL